MKDKNKKTIKIIIITIIAILALGIAFFFIAKNVTVDSCASPCKDGEVCTAVCKKVTLLDKILGK